MLPESGVVSAFGLGLVWRQSDLDIRWGERDHQALSHPISEVG